MFHNPSDEELKSSFGISDELIPAMKGLVAGAYELYETSNAHMPEGRRIQAETIETIISREGGDTPQAAKAIIDFVSTVENPATNTPTVHTDLLPSGHPLVASSRADVAAYYSTEPALPEETRALVACAIAATPESATRKFFVAQLVASGREIEALKHIEGADRILGNK